MFEFNPDLMDGDDDEASDMKMYHEPEVNIVINNLLMSIYFHQFSSLSYVIPELLYWFQPFNTNDNFLPPTFCTCLGRGIRRG